MRPGLAAGLDETTSRLPLALAAIQPEAATSLSHQVLVLLGDRPPHLTDIRGALRLALGKHDRASLRLKNNRGVLLAP